MTQCDRRVTFYADAVRHAGDEKCYTRCVIPDALRLTQRGAPDQRGFLVNLYCFWGFARCGREILHEDRVSVEFISIISILTAFQANLSANGGLLASGNTYPLHMGSSANPSLQRLSIKSLN